jgi:ribulose-phosphate 3-epimerase
MVLCMSIEPGYSGQEFKPDAMGRVRRARAALPEEIPIQVDGGIDHTNIADVRAAGASLFVAGTAIFGHADLPGAYERLVQELA